MGQPSKYNKISCIFSFYHITARGGNYFAQEFMIEDMKNMMSDLNGKFDELDEKVENVSANLKSITGGEENKDKTQDEVRIVF